MKDHSLISPDEPASTQFVDAALHEHARLGSAVDDADLIKSILTETVDRRSDANLPDLQRAEEKRFWIAGVAAAAAILAALATLLAVLPFRPSSREVEEIRFIVQYGDYLEMEDTPGLREPAPRREPIGFSGPIEIPVSAPRIETSSPPAADIAVVDAQFEPSFAEVPKPATSEDRLRIVADKTTELDGQRIYEGNVEVIHDDFRLVSEEVVLSRSDDGEAGEVILLSAVDATLTQASPGRTALAGVIDYEPAVKRFTLREVLLVDSAEGKLTNFKFGDRVYLQGETLIVQNSAQP